MVSKSVLGAVKARTSKSIRLNNRPVILGTGRDLSAAVLTATSCGLTSAT